MQILLESTAIINFLFCLGIAYYEYKRQSPGMYLWGILLVIWGIPHLKSCFEGFPPYTDETLLTCSIFSIFFMILYIFARLIHNQGKYKKKIFYNYTPTYDNKSAMFMFIVLVVFSAIRIYQMGKNSGGLLEATWSANLDVAAGQEMDLFGQIYGKTSYFLSGVFLIFMVNGKRNLALISFAVLLVAALVSRARADLLPLLVCVMTYYLFFKKKGNPILGLLKLGVLAFLAVYMVFALQMYRWAGSFNDFVEGFSIREFNELVITMMNSDEGETGLGQYFYFFVQNNNNFPGFGRAHSYIRMLLFWLPTSWSFGLKPDDFAMAMGAAVGMDKGGTMHPTLFGDCWANLGFLGIFLGYFWGWGVSMMDRFITIVDDRFRLPIYMTIASSLTLIGRGSVYNGFTFMIYICILIYIIQSIKKKPALRYEENNVSFRNTTGGH